MAVDHNKPAALPWRHEDGKFTVFAHSAPVDHNKIAYVMELNFGHALLSVLWSSRVVGAKSRLFMS